MAQTLVNNANDEADYRTAINRSYYACHLVARDRLFGDDAHLLTAKVFKQITGSKRGGSHEVVIKGIEQNLNSRRGRSKLLSDQLGELKDLRIVANHFLL